MQRLIERINRRVPAWTRENRITSGLLVSLYKIMVKFDNDFKKQIDSAIDDYRDNSIGHDRLYNDMLTEDVKFWVRPSEYSRFDIFEKTESERREYLPDFEEISIFKWTEGNNILPDSKFERYSMFNRYFKRGVLCIDALQPSDDEYKDFIADKDKVIVKPLRGTKGHGVIIVNTNDIPTLHMFRKTFQNDSLLEELIDQGDEMKQFHPQSVNTVRFVTGINHSGVFHPIFALVRAGQGGSVVDNVSSGGLVALIDMKTGQICSDAYRGTTRFESHPDTNVKFQGFKIPEWNELCSLVKEIHLSQSGQRVFGFDMAWTNKGWDLVEVNPAPSFDSYQELTGKGVRSYLYELEMI